MNDKGKRWLAGVCILLALGAALGALLSPCLDTSPIHSPGLGPGAGRLLGTDNSGRDIFSMLIRSAGTSLGISLAAAFAATIIGALLGCTAGYRRGLTDDVLMRITDIFLLVPSLPLVIVLAAYLGAGVFQIALFITLTAWSATARIIRAQVLKLREEAFVKNTGSMGGGDVYVILRHILPNCGELLLAKAALNVAGALLTESGISFLGLGDPSHPSWGSMLKDAFAGAALINGSWWWYLPPMLCISLTVMFFNLAGQALIARTPSADAGSAMPDDTGPSLSGNMLSAGDQCIPAPPLLSVRGLTVAFPNSPGDPHKPVINGLDLDIRQGEKYALVGATGAGKSLLLLAILGLLPFEAHVRGRIRMTGRDISSYSAEELRRHRGTTAAYIPQGTGCALNPVIPVGTQIAERVRIHYGFDREKAMHRALQALSAVGLPEPDQRMNDYPHHLSGGMKQRALTAMALAADPPLLLADEPTKGLDPAALEEVTALFREIENRAVLAVTHDLRFAEHLGGRIMVMFSGMVVEETDPESFFTEPLHPYSRALIAAQPARGMRGDGIAIPSNGHGRKQGCVYRHFCPLAEKRCGLTPPVSRHGGHSVRCWCHVP